MIPEGEGRDDEGCFLDLGIELKSWIYHWISDGKKGINPGSRERGSLDHPLIILVSQNGSWIFLCWEDSPWIHKGEQMIIRLAERYHDH